MLIVVIIIVLIYLMSGGKPRTLQRHPLHTIRAPIQTDPEYMAVLPTNEPGDGAHILGEQPQNTNTNMNTNMNTGINTNAVSRSEFAQAMEFVNTYVPEVNGEIYAREELQRPQISPQIENMQTQPHQTQPQSSRVDPSPRSRARGRNRKSVSFADSVKCQYYNHDGFYMTPMLIGYSN